MVVVESLACGTPVVCSTDGGPAEIVSIPEVGERVPLTSLLDLIDARRAQDLAESILRTIELARRPGTSERCREWAEQWSLDRVGHQAEQMYQEIAETHWAGASRQLAAF